MHCRYSWGDGGGRLAQHEGAHTCMEDYGHGGSHVCGRYDHSAGGPCGVTG